MPLLTQQQIEGELASLPEWSRKGDAIVRTFDRADFKGAVAFLNTVTPLAESLNHHPDIAISWKDITLTITSHSAGGLTEDDFVLARQIDQLD
ncbi:MAG: 4a-hydroxytetrahydrobiopterin dehydratase [Solirubrobacterales bacterium]